MSLIIASPGVVSESRAHEQAVVDALKRLRTQGHVVGLVSNRGKPNWFDQRFGGSGVEFLQVIGRQDGGIVRRSAERSRLNPFDCLVLCSKDEDVPMGKNGGAVLVAAGWRQDAQVNALGIRVDSPAQFLEVVDLTAKWSGDWWFKGQGASYGVRALADLSGYGQDAPQQAFARQLTGTVKNGGTRLTALLTVAARSLLRDGIAEEEGLVFGVYPSSSSDNDDQEVLSDFTHRLRTTVSRMRFSKVGEPLFVRHTPSSKRSKGGAGDRTDPTEQLCTLHLNPFYRQGGRLRGKRVVVVDDCATYGVSFAVAAALLRRAGAVAVTGVALGKFGNQLRYYDLEVTADPFCPIGAEGFVLRSVGQFAGTSHPASKEMLRELIG